MADFTFWYLLVLQDSFISSAEKLTQCMETRGRLKTGSLYLASIEATFGILLKQIFVLMEKERAFGVFGMVRPKYLKHRSVWNKSFSEKPKEAVPKSIYPHPRWDFLFEITAKSLQTYYETLRTRQMLHLSAD